MNVVYLSPHFPANQHLYCRHLRDLGVTTLGVADRAWEELSAEQRASLTDHYRVPDLEDYGAVRAAAAYFIGRHGPIDRVESHNEHWLPHEARLRAEFGIPGAKPGDLDALRRKSRMKEVFRGAGVPVAPGEPVTTLDRARLFARRAGYPIVVKPDIGVGASDTHRIDDERALEAFFDRPRATDSFMEAFVDGTIVTYDGLAGRDGRIVCSFSMEYSRGVMEVVNEDADISYFTHRHIPEDLAEMGRRAVAAFGVRERFFHMEFFRTRSGGGLVALEANLRPPGGYSVDMLNYTCDADLYRAWAQVVAGATVTGRWERLHHCGFINRKRRYAYRRSHEEVMARYGSSIVFHAALPEAFRRAMGDYAYLARTRELQDLHPITRFIQEKA